MSSDLVPPSHAYWEISESNEALYALWDNILEGCEYDKGKVLGYSHSLKGKVRYDWHVFSHEDPEFFLSAFGSILNFISVAAPSASLLGIAKDVVKGPTIYIPGSFLAAALVFVDHAQSYFMREKGYDPFEEWDFKTAFGAWETSFSMVFRLQAPLVPFEIREDLDLGKGDAAWVGFMWADNQLVHAFFRGPDLPVLVSTINDDSSGKLFAVAAWLISVVCAASSEKTSSRRSYEFSRHKDMRRHRDIMIDPEPFLFDAVACACLPWLDEDKNMKKTTITDEIPVLSLASHGGNPCIQITCNKCGGEDFIPFKRVDLSPTQYLNTWKKKRWKISGDGKKAMCPDCLQEHSEAKRKRKEANKREKERQKLMKQVQKLREQFLQLSKEDAVAKHDVLHQDYRLVTHQAQVLGVEDEGFLLQLKEVHQDLLRLDAQVAALKRRKEVQEDPEDAEFRKLVLENLPDLSPVERRSYLKSLGLTEEEVEKWGAPPSSPEPEVPVKKQFALFKLLEEHIHNGAYDYGWSDEKCAEEVGLSLNVVASIRFETYGPVENSQVAYLKEALVALEEKFKKDYEESLLMLEMIKEEYESKRTELEAALEKAQKETS